MFLLGSVGYLMLAANRVYLLVPALLLAFGAGWGWAGLLNFAIVLRNLDAPAAASGITQTGGLIGGISGSLLFGLIVDYSSYTVAWVTAGTWACVAACFALLARRSFRKLLETTRADQVLP